MRLIHGLIDSPRTSHDQVTIALGAALVELWAESEVHCPN
jgi:hypothetical protein